MIKYDSRFMQSRAYMWYSQDIPRLNLDTAILKVLNLPVQALFDCTTYKINIIQNKFAQLLL